MKARALSTDCGCRVADTSKKRTLTIMVLDWGARVGALSLRAFQIARRGWCLTNVTVGVRLLREPEELCCKFELCCDRTIGGAGVTAGCLLFTKGNKRTLYLQSDRYFNKQVLSRKSVSIQSYFKFSFSSDLISILFSSAC